jgi:hypothetical protein
MPANKAGSVTAAWVAGVASYGPKPETIFLGAEERSKNYKNESPSLIYKHSRKTPRKPIVLITPCELSSSPPASASTRSSFSAILVAEFDSLSGIQHFSESHHYETIMKSDDDVKVIINNKWTSRVIRRDQKQTLS